MGIHFLAAERDAQHAVTACDPHRTRTESARTAGIQPPQRRTPGFERDGSVAGRRGCKDEARNNVALVQ